MYQYLLLQLGWTVGAACCFDADLALAVRADLCGRSSGCLRLFADGGDSVQCFYDHEDDKGSDQEIDNGRNKLADQDTRSDGNRPAEFG